MPHRSIGSRWRARTIRDWPFVSVRQNDVVRIVANEGTTTNTVFLERTGRQLPVAYTIEDRLFELVEDAAPAPAAREVAVFTPNEDERYFVAYREHGRMRRGEVYFTIDHHNRDPKTLEQARALIRNNYAPGYEYFLIPARAVERYSDGGSRMTLDADFGARVAE